MIQNSHLKPSPIKRLFTDRNPAKEDIDNFQEEVQQNENQNPASFMKRFKNNQETLRNKFKTYVDKQKYLFPRTYQKFRASGYAEPQRQSNIREIRREKEEMIDEMNRSKNETSYYLNRNRAYTKACDILANKWRRVQSIRSQRKSEVIKLQKSLNALRQQIKNQKMVLVRQVSNSKHKLMQSRMEFKQRKLSLAQDVRAEREVHRSKISSQKMEIYNQKKLKCKTVRDDEQKVSFYVDRVKQQKKQIGKDLRLSKLFREITERQEVKIDSAKVKRKSKRKIEHLQSSTFTLEQKIKEFRQSLGERRLIPLSKIKIDRFQKNHSFSQSNQFTTHSQPLQFLHRSDTEPFETE